MKETEKNALQEKLNNAHQTVRDLEVELEKQKRQANTRHEKDRVENQSVLFGVKYEVGCWLTLNCHQHCSRIKQVLFTCCFKLLLS